MMNVIVITLACLVVGLDASAWYGGGIGLNPYVGHLGGYNPFVGGINPYFGGINPYFGGCNPYFDGISPFHGSNALSGGVGQSGLGGLHGLGLHGLGLHGLGLNSYGSFNPLLGAGIGLGGPLHGLGALNWGGSNMDTNQQQNV